MSTVATPELLERLIADYAVRHNLEQAIEAYIERTQRWNQETAWDKCQSVISREREGISDEILMLNCLDGETIRMRDKFVVDFDLISMCAELAGCLIEEQKKSAIANQFKKAA